MVSSRDHITEIFRLADNRELKEAVEAYITEGDRRHGPIGTWDTSRVTDMSGIFIDYLGRYQDFNEDISGWDTSRVTDMNNMFWGACNFNQQLDTHTVTRSDGTTYQAWDVSRVTNMKGMFSQTLAFNQPLSMWNVSNVTNMSAMFLQTRAFNEDISTWNTSSVTSMRHMFDSAENFNQSLNKRIVTQPDGSEYEAWDTSNLIHTTYMFYGAIAMLADYLNLPRDGDIDPNYWEIYFPIIRNKPTKSATTIRVADLC